MLLLPGGRFTMGTFDKTAPPNERPPHAVTIAPFWIDKTEVTVAAYRACVASHAARAPRRRAARAPTSSTTVSSPRLVRRVARRRRVLPVRGEADCPTNRSGSSRARSAPVPLSVGRLVLDLQLREHALARRDGEDLLEGAPRSRRRAPARREPLRRARHERQRRGVDGRLLRRDVRGGRTALRREPHAARRRLALVAEPVEDDEPRLGSSVEAGPNVGFRCAKMRLTNHRRVDGGPRHSDSSDDDIRRVRQPARLEAHHVGASSSRTRT